MGWLSNDLKPDRTQPKGLIVNARILWAFLRRSPASARSRCWPEMADRAFDFVMNRFWDAQHGGAFWRLDDAGQVLDDSKKIYGQAFYHLCADGISPGLRQSRGAGTGEGTCLD